MGALRKHDDNQVKEQARSLVKKWRDILDGSAPSASSSASSSSRPLPSSSKSTPTSSPARSPATADAAKFFRGQEGERVKIQLYNSVVIHQFTKEEKELHFLVPEEVAFCIDEAIVEALPQGRAVCRRVGGERERKRREKKEGREGFFLLIFFIIFLLCFCRTKNILKKH